MKTKHKVIISTVVILILTAASVFSIAAEKLPQYRKIVVTSAAKRTMGQTINIKGYIEPFEKQEINLDTTQKVSAVYVQEGQAVKAGDLLFKLDDTDSAYRLKSEQLSLKAAQSELSNLLKSETKDKKDLTFSVAQAELAYKNAVDELNDAKIRCEDNQKLYSEGFISKEELDNGLRSLSKLESTKIMQEMQLERAKHALDNYDDERQQQIDKLKSNIELIQMNIDNLNSKIDISTKALINGIVIRCKLQNDQYPSVDSTKVEVYDLSQYLINIYIKQNEAVQVIEGQKASIRITGLEQKTYLGTVIEVEDTATMLQGGTKVPMVKVKIAVDEPDQNIRVGFEAQVSLDLNIRTDVVAIDFQGIVEDHNGNKFVYMFKDNKATRKLVKTGIEDGFLVEIVEGLIPGDQYILNPPERVQNESSFKLWSWGYELK
ncbi:MAG: HlyD family efflux transporter periplasmic adaptor subunit [Clostridia bacterium]|jgi:HlyD family secretion protein|nr:HlyD family efflux transporter periplasmic adaptor subunit [Clostridia bacterium]